MKPLSKKKVDAMIDEEYKRQGSGLCINMLDIPRLFSDCRRAHTGGRSIADAMAEGITKYGVRR